MRIGIIGYGGRLGDSEYGVFSALKREEPEAVLVAITDPDLDNVKLRLEKSGMDPKEIHFYENAEEMLDSEHLDGVMIGTRCDLHTTYAVEVMRRGLPLFLEKPVATTMSDLIKLHNANQQYKSPVVVSFPLRLTEIARLAKEIVDSGEIGTVQNVVAWNDVPYGGVYFHDWYRDESITQGLFLQKATHDFDLINYMIGLEPKSICAMNAKMIFKGDMEPGLTCSECDRKYTCTESSWYITNKRQDVPHGDFCCYAKDTGNEDSGAAIIRYSTGMFASYSQNFFARHQVGRRGMRLYGYEGTLEFDFYMDTIVKVFSHMKNKSSVYQVPKVDGGHGGGDSMLVRNFANVIRQKEESLSTLDSGILSALMCLKAKESAENDRFCDICF